MAAAAKSRFMFVEYSAPAPPVKGQKKRRGGPSEVRAHITKEFHRRLRIKRLDALKGNAPLVERPKLARLPQDDEDEEQSRAQLLAAQRPSKSPSKANPLQFNASRCLQTVLGEGRTDPFDVLPTLPNQRLHPFVIQVLDHGALHLPLLRTGLLILS